MVDVGERYIYLSHKMDNKVLILFYSILFHSLSVLVEGHYQLLAPGESPLTIKSSFHHSEPRKEYHFVYRPGRTESEGQEAESEEPAPTAETEPDEEKSLIEI